jgi:hypothetical protein
MSSLISNISSTAADISIYLLCTHSRQKHADKATSGVNGKDVEGIAAAHRSLNEFSQAENNKNAYNAEDCRAPDRDLQSCQRVIRG